ncbi:MAG: hypothetical protein FWE67_03115, partial [Planctomycetaceae bacterium]|nr:hypothetical protein [Planctomycetaceae bacterium]
MDYNALNTPLEKFIVYYLETAGATTPATIYKRFNLNKMGVCRILKKLAENPDIPVQRTGTLYYLVVHGTTDQVVQNTTKSYTVLHNTESDQVVQRTTSVVPCTTFSEKSRCTIVQDVQERNKEKEVSTKKKKKSKTTKQQAGSSQ